MSRGMISAMPFVLSDTILSSVPLQWSRFSLPDACWPGLLYGVSAVDGVTIASVLLVLGGVAAPASMDPARPASRVDPTVVCGTSEHEHS